MTAFDLKIEHGTALTLDGQRRIMKRIVSDLPYQETLRPRWPVV